MISLDKNANFANDGLSILFAPKPKYCLIYALYG